MEAEVQETDVQILAREAAAVAPTLARYTSIIAERGEGSYLYDRNGRRFLDFASGIATNNVGHCHPRVVSAAVEQTKKLIHSCGSVVHFELHVQLAEKLAQITPSGVDMCFFSNSGAEAVEGALKLARYVTRRPVTIAFAGAFHGRTLGAVSVTSSKAHYRAGYQPLLPGVFMAPYPYCFRCALGHQRDSCSLECLSYLRFMLNTVAPPQDVAAMLIEPVLGEGGYTAPPLEYLQGLRDLCDQHGILLIFDEVQTGFGRTGEMFASQTFGIQPDVITVAKGIAGGFPLSAIVGPSRLMKDWPSGAHGSTFGGNPVSCAAALASIGVIEEEGLLENARIRGAELTRRLEEIRSDVPAIGDVRGIGLMIGIELCNTDGSPNKEAVILVGERCQENGLILLSCGTSENVIRLIPPLNVSEDEVEQALDVLEGALRALTQ
ncbi:MAG: aspartate aminotransferase family protein [Chloroflexi bacterium]|nr:aspartate aminotransferase family protein [Chloroflexota bacterium]